MQQMTKDHHEEVNLRVRSHKNLRFWRHLTMSESGVGPQGTESSDPRPKSHYLGKDNRLAGRDLT